MWSAAVRPVDSRLPIIHIYRPSHPSLPKFGYLAPAPFTLLSMLGPVLADYARGILQFHLPGGGRSLSAPRLSSSQPYVRSSCSATPPVAASDATWTPLPNTTTRTTTSTMAAAPEVAYKSGIVKEVPSGDCVRAPRSSSDPPHLSPVCWCARCLTRRRLPPTLRQRR